MGGLAGQTAEDNMFTNRARDGGHVKSSVMSVSAEFEFDRVVRRTRESLLSAVLAVSAATMTLAGGTAQSAGDSGACQDLFRLANTMDFDHAWTGTIRLRQMESSCVGSENEPTYWSVRSTMENLLGNHRGALEYFRQAISGPGSRQELPANAESKPALGYILEQAAGHQVVMVNERHHVSTERLLTLELLHPLYHEQGFRYLAVEALWAGEDQLNRRGYPIRETGGYVSDIVFGELIREALSIGNRVVPYEASQAQMKSTETMNRQQARDYWQAQTLISATLAQDSEAKVLVHCGYDHLVESARSGWTPMAYYFAKATGLDPLTVDQTELAEKGSEEMEHSWRLTAEARGLVHDIPVVLVDGNGDLLPVEPMDVDIKVLNPPAEYRSDRPAWMAMGGRRIAIAVPTPECVEKACVVEAFDPVWEERAVPYDRLETNSAETLLYVPAAGHVQVQVRGHRLDGSPVFLRELVREEVSPISAAPAPTPALLAATDASH